MSENAVTPVNPKKSRIKIILIGLSVVILMLLYGAGIIVLPISILTNFQAKDCNSVLFLNNIYAGIYPEFVEDKTLSAPVQECTAYTLATSNEEQGSWSDAYDAYQTYSSKYPNGSYAKESHQHSATVLVNMVRDQIEGQNYEEALANLNLVIASYSDTGVITDAWILFPSVYTPWGIGLREAGDFERSAQVLNDFQTWSLTNQKSESATDAQRELVQTYLAWGLAFQSQKQFENAIAKLDMAISIDPQSQFDSAAEVKSSQRKVYIEWGNDLLERNEFPVAIEKFSLAISKAEGDKDDVARDALINGYIQWASALSTDEDFLGALDQLELAKDAALTDSLKQSVDTALEETYVAFSKSTGEQARRVIKDTLTVVCQKHKKPELPIFGLNKDSIRFGIYGADAELSKDVAARTPGEMHYIACVEVQNQIVETRSKKQIVLYVSRGYYYTFVKQMRAQLLWDISLVETLTGDKVAEDILPGGTPPPFPESADSGGGYFFGSPPTREELAEWLLSAIK